MPLDSKTNIFTLEKALKDETLNYFEDVVAVNIYNNYNAFIKHPELKVAIADRIWSSSKYYTQYLNHPARLLQMYLNRLIHDSIKENNIKVYYVFLSGSPQEILNNIRSRERDYETDYNNENVKRLIEIYQTFSDLEGLDYKIKTCQIGHDFYRNEVAIIEQFLAI